MRLDDELLCDEKIVCKWSLFVAKSMDVNCDNMHLFDVVLFATGVIDKACFCGFYNMIKLSLFRCTT